MTQVFAPLGTFMCEASLLYAAAPKLKPAKLRDHVANTLDGSRVTLVEGARDAAVLDVDGVILRLAVWKEPCSEVALAPARQSGVIKTRPHDYDADIKKHNAQVCVAVEAEERDRDIPIDRQLRILMSGVMAMLQAQTPLLVAWHQSKMIFRPEEITFAAKFRVPLPVCVHPELFADKYSKGNLGVRLTGAHRFAGRTIVIDPSERHIEESINIGLSMMVAKHNGFLPLNHGDALDTPTGETLFVRHEDRDDVDPHGRLCLGLEQPRPQKDKAAEEAAAQKKNDNVAEADADPLARHLKQRQLQAAPRVSPEQKQVLLAHIQPERKRSSEPAALLKPKVDDPNARYMPVVVEEQVDASRGAKLSYFVMAIAWIFCIQFALTPGNGTKIARMLHPGVDMPLQ